MGFHHVGQAGLELLTSGDPLALASQSAGMTGVSCCARPYNQLLFIIETKPLRSNIRLPCGTHELINLKNEFGFYNNIVHIDEKVPQV